MTSPIVDFSEIDLTGSVKFEDQQIGSVHYNGERLWPFGVDLLYTGVIGGASYLPDQTDVYGASALAAFSDGVSAVLDEKNGTPVLGPELVTSGVFTSPISLSNSVGANQAIGTVVGASYLVSYRVTAFSGSGNVRLSLGTLGLGLARNSIGTYSEIISTPAGSSPNNVYAFISVSTSATIDNISVREVPGRHALQPSASLRPLLGRAPKERRNLLTFTEQFDNAAWTKSNSVVTANAAVAPDGTNTADLLYPSTTGSDRRVISPSIALSTSAHTVSAYIKAAGKSWAYLLVPQANTINDVVWFDLANGAVGTTGSAATSASIQSVGNGWYRCVVTGLADATSFYAINVADTNGSTTATANGTDGILIWGAQLETGSTASAYQRVGAVTDVTEAGVPFYPFVRFDLSDDRLDTVLPQAVTGDVVIAGRNGSVIASHSYAANTTFQLGPTSYTGGTPGVLRAIGDVVGWSILNKTMTAAEQERLMRFYKRRGAKGLLVPGPEALSNGTFAGDSTAGWARGFNSVDGTFTASGGVATYTDGAGDGLAPRMCAAITGLTVGRFYHVSFNRGAATGAGDRGVVWTSASDGTGGSTLLQVVASTWNNAGLQTEYVQATATTMYLAVFIALSNNGDTVSISQISVREVRPEEDW